MARKIKDNPQDYPALGRWMMWVDKPGSVKKLIVALAVVCGLTLLANFTYSDKGHYDSENIPGFYAIFGFIAFTFIVLAAKTLRILIKRPEDYYGNKAVDRETWPETELELKDHHDD